MAKRSQTNRMNEGNNEDSAIPSDIRQVELRTDVRSILRNRMLVLDATGKNMNMDNADDEESDEDIEQLPDDVRGTGDKIAYLTTSYFRNKIPLKIILPILALALYQVPELYKSLKNYIPDGVTKKVDDVRKGFEQIRYNATQLKAIEKSKTGIENVNKQIKEIKDQMKEKNLSSKQKEDLTAELEESMEHLDKLKLEKSKNADNTIVYEAKKKIYELRYSKNQFKKLLAGLAIFAKTGTKFGAYLAGLSYIVYTLYPVCMLSRHDETLAWECKYDQKKACFEILRADDTGLEMNSTRYSLQLDPETQEWLLFSSKLSDSASRQPHLKLNENLDNTSTPVEWTTTNQSSDNENDSALAGNQSSNRYSQALLVFPSQFNKDEKLSLVTQGQGLSKNDVFMTMPRDYTYSVPLDFMSFPRISFGETYYLRSQQKVAVPMDVIVLAIYSIRSLYVMPMGILLFLAALIGGSALFNYVIKYLRKNRNWGVKKTEEAVSKSL